MLAAHIRLSSLRQVHAMKKMKIEAFDDVDAKRGHEVAADKADIPLAWNGKAVTLDLSQARFDQVTAFLAPYLKAGTPLKPSANPDRPQRPAEALAIQAASSPPLYERMREFAELHGLPKPREYKKTDGSTSWTYPQRTRVEFEKAQVRNGASADQPGTGSGKS
jgi:hypothetical protein